MTASHSDNGCTGVPRAIPIRRPPRWNIARRFEATRSNRMNRENSIPKQSIVWLDEAGKFARTTASIPPDRTGFEGASGWSRRRN